MKFSVKEVIDGNTISVAPRWKWDTSEGPIYGSLVKIDGYAVKSPEHQSLAVAILETLLKPKTEDLVNLDEIKLKNPKSINKKTSVMECSVYLNGVNIAEYFTAF